MAVYAAATKAHMALLLQPLAPSSESGEFSDYEMLAYEFSTLLASKVRPELLAPGADAAKLNNSCARTARRGAASIAEAIRSGATS